MKNQGLIDWAVRLTADYEAQIQRQFDVIESIEAGTMHSWTNGKDTTAESLERARQAVKAYQEGIQIMEQARTELAFDG